MLKNCVLICIGWQLGENILAQEDMLNCSLLQGKDSLNFCRLSEQGQTHLMKTVRHTKGGFIKFMKIKLKDVGYNI